MKNTLPHVPRITAPVKERDGVTIVDIDNYAPFLLNAIGNAWQRKTSAIYRREFDLGIGEWRIMSMLNIEPNITANRVCDVIKMDKAAVSRSLKLLLALGLVEFDAPSAHSRKRSWRLSPQGLEMHAQILSRALQAEAELVEGLTPEELETCLRVLRKMLSRF